MTTPTPENNSQGYGSQPTYGQPTQAASYGQTSYGQPGQPGAYPPAFNQPYPGFKPRPHVGFGEAIKKHFKYLFHFSGRASRSEFWWVQLFYALIMLIMVAGLIISLVASVSASDSGNTGASDVAFGTFFVFYILIIVVALVISILNLALTWRRLQDAGFHGAISLLNFAGVGIVPLVMCFMDSSPSGAQYDGPKDVDRP